jgi:hypothetical protein
VQNGIEEGERKRGGRGKVRRMRETRRLREKGALK